MTQGDYSSLILSAHQQVNVIGSGLIRLKDGRVIAVSAGPLFVAEERCWVGDLKRKRWRAMLGDVVIGTIVENNQRSDY